jgi:hypothetical protein
VQQVGVKNFTYLIYLHGKCIRVSFKFGFIRGGTGLENFGKCLLLGKGHSNIQELMTLPEYGTTLVCNLQFSSKCVSSTCLSLCPMIWQLCVFQATIWEQILVLYLCKCCGPHWCYNCRRIEICLIYRLDMTVNIGHIACPMPFKTVTYCPCFPTPFPFMFSQKYTYLSILKFL